MLLFFPKRSSMSPEDRKKLDVWLGPMYLPYKPKYQAFFEVVMLLRRLILAFALSMIPSSSTLQTFVVWLVLMVSSIIHLILRPYDTQPGRREGETDNQSSEAFSVRMSLSLLCCSSYRCHSWYYDFELWMSTTLTFLFGL